MAVIAFDLDGTLIDSHGHIHACLSAALADLDLPQGDAAWTKGYVGRGIPHFIDCACRDRGIDRATTGAVLEQRMLHHYATLPSDPATIYPGVTGALAALTDAGHSLALCTNKPFAATMAALRDTGLDRWFDPVLCGDSLPTRKPDPAMLLATGATLYVGDSETDAETAEAAAIRFLLFTEGYRKGPPESMVHHALFDRFSHLPALVATLA